MDLIDIGANLSHESFHSDMDAVLERARNAGIVHLIVTGASRVGSLDSLRLAQLHPGFLSATAGVHPHHAQEVTDEGLSELRLLLAYPEIVAVGECGLDYFRDFSPRLVQRNAFEKQLQLAAECGKPMFLHQRDAHADFMSMMKNFDGCINKSVVHCFTGSKEECFAYLDADFYIGITGWLCDERRGQHLRDIVPHIPNNRLLIETDSPYLLPRTIRPKPKKHRNEPMYLKHIIDELANDRGEAVIVTARDTTANAKEFFGLS